jgi:glycosyltransferase involved in cell wall biosynthesis
MLAQFYPPVIGGEENHVRNLSLEMARRGHDVHVATLQLPGGAEPVSDPGVTVHCLEHAGLRVPQLYPASDRPLALPLPDPVLSRALHRLSNEVRPDVVHAHNWIVNSWVPLPAARRLPLVLSLHDYSHVCATKRLIHDGAPCAGPGPLKCPPCASEHYGSRARGGVIFASVAAGRPVRNRVVDVFTPVSRFVAGANQLPEGRTRYEVVPNFVPDELTERPLSARDPALPEGPYLFFAGDLSAQKGVTTLLAAYDRLPALDRPALVLVGRPFEPLPDPLPDGAVVSHHWAHDRVVSGFQHALAAVLPSEWPDPCPTTVLEAMALGAPLVTTDRGGIGDMVVDGESALVSRAGDVASLEQSLRRIIDDDALRRHLAAGAAVGVRSFLRSTVVDHLEKIYASLV